MDVVLLAEPVVYRWPDARAGRVVANFPDFECWRDEQLDLVSSPDLVFVGTTLKDLLRNIDVYQALISMFDVGIFPRAFVLTSRNPLALLRQSKLLKLMGYISPVAGMWIRDLSDY